MREILFRGKRLDNGEWVFGNYDSAASGKMAYIRTPNEKWSDVNMVDPDTVCQYTGIFTMEEIEGGDSRCTFIYEGDICKIVRDGVLVIGIVEIYNGTFGLRYKSGEFNSFLYLKRSRPEGCWFDTLEVIGNIYDNPELLEVTK